MKKLCSLLIFACLLVGCKKSVCWECKNVDNQVMQTYCDVEEAIAISNASIWSVQQMQNISNTIMTDERRREELRRVTFNRCDKKQ